MGKQVRKNTELGGRFSFFLAKKMFYFLRFFFNF